MKITRFILCALLALVGVSASADPYNMILTQRNAADTGNNTRIQPTPSGPAVWSFDTNTLLPGYWTLGPGLSVTSGVLDVASGAGQVNSDWNAVSGVAKILNRPTLSTVALTGQYGDLSGAPTLFSGAYADLTGKPTLFSGAYADLTGKPTLFSGSYSDLTGKPTFATVATSGAYADLSGKPALATVATSGNYTDLTNKPTIPTVTVFDFSQPVSRTLAVSTDYQASNTAKAAVIYPSFACTNATTVLAASACTIQVRQSASTLTCSTGVVVYTINLSVSLGLLLTQASTNPGPIFVPIGGHVIFCPTSGTFTVSTAEQSAG